MSPHPQLTLQFQSDSTLSFDNFWLGDNALPVSRIRALCSMAGEEAQLYLHGPGYSGKTHLLHAACQQATQAGYRIAYLGAADIYTGSMLSGLTGLDFVCIDDLHLLPDDDQVEVALFDLINGLREQHKRLLLASRVPPADLSISLPDLATRLSWGAAYSISAVGDDSLRDVLRHRIDFTGTVVSEETLDYLCTHFSRDLPSMLDRLKRLDLAAMQEKRRITIPLIREVLRSSTDHPVI